MQPTSTFCRSDRSI